MKVNQVEQHVACVTVRTPDAVYRISCSKLMPMDPFIAELKRLGYDTILRTPSGDPGALDGEIIHVVGALKSGVEMRQMVGHAKVQAILSQQEKPS